MLGAPERPAMAEKLKFARPKVAECYAGEPGKLRSCAKIAPKLLNNCETTLRSKLMEPCLGHQPCRTAGLVLNSGGMATE